MLEQLNTIPSLLILSFLFGFFTKLADLLDEHGLTMFRGAKLLTGILWGTLGASIVISNPLLGSFYLAILVNWIIKGNIDYFNHRIATAIMLIATFFSEIISKLDLKLFLITLTLFTGIGLLARYNLIKKNFLVKNNLFIFIALAIMIYFNFSYWIVFVSYFLNSLAYFGVKKWGQKNIKDY